MSGCIGWCHELANGTCVQRRRGAVAASIVVPLLFLPFALFSDRSATFEFSRTILIRSPFLLFNPPATPKFVSYPLIFVCTVQYMIGFQNRRRRPALPSGSFTLRVQPSRRSVLPNPFLSVTHVSWVAEPRIDVGCPCPMRIQLYPGTCKVQKCSGLFRIIQFLS